MPNAQPTGKNAGTGPLVIIWLSSRLGRGLRMSSRRSVLFIWLILIEVCGFIYLLSTSIDVYSHSSIAFRLCRPGQANATLLLSLKRKSLREVRVYSTDTSYRHWNRRKISSDPKETLPCMEVHYPMHLSVSVSGALTGPASAAGRDAGGGTWELGGFR